MIADNNLAYDLVDRLLDEVSPEGGIRPLNATRLEAIDMEADGIAAHVGIDGDIYYDLYFKGQKLNLCGRNYERMIEFVFKALSMRELCSLLGEEAPAEGKKITTVSFFTDFGYWSDKSQCICGSMGYTFGGDYEESERRVDATENEQDVLKEYKEGITNYVQENTEDQEDEKNFDIYTIEKHTYETVLDEQGDEIESEEVGEKEIVANIICCSRERTLEIGLEEKYPHIFSKAENIYLG